MATLRANAASGDRDAGDGRLETFNALFPTARYFGELSPLGPYNIVNLDPALELRPRPDVGVGIAGIVYWRQRRGDGIHDVPGIRCADPAAAAPDTSAASWRRA